MWRTTLFMVLAFILAFTSHVAAQVILDPTKCYTLSTNGTNYLDSTNSVIKIQVHANRTELEAGTDQGVRFHFPLGEGGWVVCEAHDEHYVGTAIPNNNEWATEHTILIRRNDAQDSLASTVSLATIHLTSSGTQAYLNAGPRQQLTATAGVGPTAFDWDIQEINCLLS
ncbi:hypothetical protein MSAN_01728700 [Mycena sanguinolenta]|uniref:DOMON domain-containing protein n=1 Tax=Mycena sanguinolenta TaxID=230812 RepID=A0A8H7CT44_9AGAR|nr:hypothetical protein MSAN_01728700 [Mycena sanguinolenta]